MEMVLSSGFCEMTMEEILWVEGGNDLCLSDYLIIGCCTAVGAIGGGVVGGLTGAAAGSSIPGIGTVWGAVLGIVGGVIDGGLLGATVGIGIVSLT